MSHDLTCLKCVHYFRGGGGALRCEIDRCRVPVFAPRPGASGERKIAKIWGHWVTDCILVQNHGGIGWECNFWSFCEIRSSPIEATSIEFLTLKRKIVHRIFWNNHFAVEIEKLLVLGDRSKEKIGGHIEWDPSIFNKNMGSLGDNSAENGDLNSPTYATPSNVSALRLFSVHKKYAPETELKRGRYSKCWHSLLCNNIMTFPYSCPFSKWDLLFGYSWCWTLALAWRLVWSIFKIPVFRSH